MQEQYGSNVPKDVEDMLMQVLGTIQDDELLDEITFGAYDDVLEKKTEEIQYDSGKIPGQSYISILHGQGQFITADFVHLKHFDGTQVLEEVTADFNVNIRYGMRNNKPVMTSKTNLRTLIMAGTQVSNEVLMNAHSYEKESLKQIYAIVSGLYPYIKESINELPNRTGAVLTAQAATVLQAALPEMDQNLEEIKQAAAQRANHTIQ